MDWTARIARTIAIGLLALLAAADAVSAGGQTLLAQLSGQPSSQITASKHDWWQNAVIYEIYPRSFQDSNRDGIGDLNGITQRLDYLEELGVDAIWLTPVYPSPQVDFGYDISDYKNIDPQYGTLADFDRLVAEAAKRHIRVIMDMVMNHTSDQHEWFLQSRSSRDNPYRDWYVWQDPRHTTPNGLAPHSGQAPGQTSNHHQSGDLHLGSFNDHPKDKDLSLGTPDGKGLPPNNWQSLFGHSAWEWDEKTHQYYYHKFYVQQPDLNWNNPKVHEAFKEIMSFWLQRGVGGFRFDAITTLFEDPSLADEGVVKDKHGNPIINAYGDPQLDGSKTDNQPGLHQVMREMRAAADDFNTDHFPGTRVLIGETYLPNIEELAKMYGAPHKPEFHLPMDTQVGFINKLDVTKFRRKLIDAETHLHAHIPLLLFDNHDNPRLDVRYGDGVHDLEIQRVLATILFTSRGAALFYYGDEIGMKTTPPPRKQDVKDPIGITGWPKEKGRDGERTPMQWDASANAGFTTGTPWLPVPPSAAAINVEAAQADPNSLLQWYKSLIRLKKTHPAFANGSNLMLDTENTKVLSWMRQTRGAPQVVAAVNFTAQPQTVNLTTSGAGLVSAHLKTLLKSPGGPEPVSLDKIELLPFGVYIGEVQ